MELRGQFLLPVEAGENGSQLELSGYTCSLALFMAKPVGDRAALTAEIGPGIDIIRRSTVRVSYGTYAAKKPSVDPRPVTTLALGARREIGTTAFAGALVLAAQWSRTRYEIGGVEQPVFGSWILQPGIRAGLSW